MAGIISNVDSDVQKLRKLKNEIKEVKKALKGINIKVDVDIAKGMEAQLKSLTDQYNALVTKVAEAEGKIILSTKRINDASNKIIQAQEKISKVTGISSQPTATQSTPSNTAETASIQAQAKAYDELRDEIDGIIGTRSQNIKRMIDESDAIRLINAEIKKITKSQGEYSSLSSTQKARLEQLNNSLLTHKIALAEVRQNLSNNVKMDNAAATSMNGLSQSLSRMRMTYRELTEEERKSPFGKELLMSINQADAKIKELDATIGNHQRNVGNYVSGWNGLQYQMQMVAREMPNFAINPQIGIMSLTNNIPYLVDELKKAKDAHKAYIAEVKAGNKELKAVPSVGRQVLHSLLSWQTGLIMAITLITAYRKEISEWVSSLFKAKKTLSETYQVTEEFQKSVSQSSGKVLATIEKLSRAWMKLGDDVKSKEKFILDYKSELDSAGIAINNVADAENLLSKNKDAFINAIIGKAKATAIMKLASIEYEKYIQKMLEADAKAEEGVSFLDRLKSWMARSAAGEDLSGTLQKADLSPEAYAKEEEAKLRKDAENHRTSMLDFIKKALGIDEESNKEIEKAGGKSKDILVANSIEAIEAAISAKRKELKKVTNRKDYLKIEAEIEAEQAKLYAIIGNTKQENQADKLRQEQEKYKLLLDKQKLDRLRANEDLQMQVDEARIKAMDEGSAKTIAEMELNYKKELQAIDRQKEDVLRKKIGDARSVWEANPQNKGKSFDDFYKEAQQLQSLGDEMATLFGGGNVDLLARPMIDAAKLVEKGWKDAEDGIATVFSSSYQVNQGGKEVMIQVTPILPDGTVLSQNELEEYIDSRLNGAKDVLEADNKGIVIHVDTDVSPEKSEEFGQKLHEYQEKFYDGISKLKKQDANFDFSWLGLDGKENELFNSLYESATGNYEKTYAGLINQYQSYADERLAIEKKYNDNIAVLQEARKKAETKGNTDEVAKIERSIAKATADRGKELMRHDFDVLKQSPEYVRAFENLKQTSTETLSSLLSQLEEAKRTAAEVLNPEDLREYTSTIQSIVAELTERNPFQTIIAKKKELAGAEQELAKAKKLLDATDKKGYAILADYNEKTGETVYTYLTATEALKKYNEAKDHVIKTDGELQAAEKKVSEQVGELANALKDIGGVIGGTSGEIISLMGDIYSFTSLSIEGISKLSSEAAKEMSALEKSSVILGIISAAIRLLQQLDSFIGDAHSQYEGYAEKIAEINKLTDAVNEYRLAALEAQQAEESWFSEDNLGNLRHFRELHEEIADAYDEKANEKQAVYENEGGGGWLTSLWKPFTTLIDKTYGKVFGFNINKEYEEGTAKATDNLRIETRKKSKGFLGTGIGGKSQKTEDLVAWARKNGFGELFDEGGLINKEAGRAILEEYGEKLVGQTKETLEELLELREKYDEYIDQLHEYVNSMYEPLVDNFVDAIFDWLDTGKDALDSFRDYASDTFRNIARDMVKSLVISQIFGTGEDSFQNKINALYEQYSKGELTEEELNRKVAEETALLGKKAEEKLPVIQESTGVIADVLEQVAGIDIRDKGGSTSQSSTSGYSSVASQESIDETNGRLTGVQMGVEELKVQNSLQTESLNLLTAKADAILSVNTETRNIADDTRDLIANSYLELVQISENTGNSAKYLKDIKADIAEVKKNTSKL